MTLQPMKRIEIVIDSPHLPDVLEALRAAAVSGYTVLPGVAGYGERGEQYADEVSGASTNAYVLVAIPEQMVSVIVDAVEPLLRQSGGVCLVSDCQWLVH
ncbi:P-II family nitrogen regulator [Phycisphaerales bacterium AB-hyl4]|uniref:P-II family nitrogen regulator n=1 Tax=Natronomicrosphaera hydrolytica TaxID=3242702 RepID=A0ABV4U1W1_9BACT